MRSLWSIVGFTSLGLGLVGVVLPLLPTVPFMLLAAFCFARSSERMHNWLLSHEVFGPLISDWQTRGAIGKRAKYAATCSIIFVFGLSFALGTKQIVITIQAITLSAVLVFIWSRPNS